VARGPSAGAPPKAEAPIAFTTEQTPKFSEDQALTLTKQSPTGGGQPQAVCHPEKPLAFSSKDHGADAGELSPTLRAGAAADSHANAGVPPAVLVEESTSAVVTDGRGRGDGNTAPTLCTDHASRPSDFCPIVFEPRFVRNGRSSPDDLVPPLKAQVAGPQAAIGKKEAPAILDEYNQTGHDLCYPLRTAQGDGIPKVSQEDAVRRLTPVECERLQGFRDNYTLIPWDSSKRDPEDRAETVRYLRELHGMSQEDAERLADTPDGPRYKALGNSMNTGVMRWIGERIEAVEKAKKDLA
jgi:DNA (cytosine-5)-methyltransferase 1